MKRRLLWINPAGRRWQLETLHLETLDHDPRQDYLFLSGETLCQYLLRRDPATLIIARGPLPFLSGNKASVGYVSPLTAVPHYSFVGGRAAAQLLNLGLDAICLQPGPESLPERPPYVVVSGRAPNLQIAFEPAGQLPAGQRSAFYWLLERELDGRRHAGSIFSLGEAAWQGFRAANLAVEAIYHAGRGGAGAVFCRSAAALVLRGDPLEQAAFFAGDTSAFARNPNAAIAPLLDKYCARLSRKTGGTITKLFTTGADPAGRNTLPSWNAQRLGHPLADVGDRQVLQATRQGQTGCHWCQVDCRHWHWVPADYAPGGRDMFLDDFEPTYAILSMLGLSAAEDTLQGRLELLEQINQHILLPIEQLGCDVMDVGLGLAALLEGVERGLVPALDVPPFLAQAGGLGDMEAIVQAVALLRSGQAAAYSALRAIGNGPQALAERYPPMQDLVFTGGEKTLGNAGHCNALWTFLMPFSRFFSHYSGQLYKIDETLPPPGSDQIAYHACFERVVQQMLQKEFFWLLGNALSMCAFTFVIFSQEGKGEQLSDDDLLIRLLRNYGLHSTRQDLEWFAQAFWAQSIELKCRSGWKLLSAEDFPRRVYEALALALERTPEELQSLMEMLIREWKRQAEEVMCRFGYEVSW